MPASLIDDLISSDDDAPPPVPTGRLSTESLSRVSKPVGKSSRAAPKAAAARDDDVEDLLSSDAESAAPPASALHQAAGTAQARARKQQQQVLPPRFNFHTSPERAAGGEGSLLLQEAGATGHAALDEATLYDAAGGGAALSELMTSLLHAGEAAPR